MRWHHQLNGHEFEQTPEDRRGFPLAQTVKNLPTMQETWVRSPDQEDALEKRMAIHFGVLAWRIPMDRGAWQAIVRGVAKSQT